MNKSNTNFSWLLRMAWRDGKASGKRLLLFMASIIMGIAAVVSIQSFSKNLEDNIGLQSKALMGADYLIDTPQVPTEAVQSILDSLGGPDGTEVSFASMAAFPGSGNNKLVQVRGIGGAFPLYGFFETIPVEAAQNYKTQNGALVDATLMLQFRLSTGDSVKIGNTVFPIIGSLKAAPGSNAFATTMAPPVILPYASIESTGLLQLGSRIKYNYYFKAAPEMDIDALDKAIDPKLDDENADFDSHHSVSERLGSRYDNFAKFLNLVAFIALLLGCVGIASSVHIYIKEKLRAVAVLKCLGATRRQSFLIYLIQIAGLGFIGGLIGTMLGLGLQALFPLFIQDLLPFDVEISFKFLPAIMGLLLGVFMSVLFALLPLLSTWFVSPLQVLRVTEDSDSAGRKTSILVILLIMAFIFIFSLWFLESWKYALGFVGAILVTFSILAAISYGFMFMIKKYFPHSWGFTARQSLLNLFRPNNQTMVLILAIGIGSFLISTLYFTKDILLSKASLEDNANNPNIILLDIQTNQKEGVSEAIEDKGLTIIDNIPIITMRVHSINGIMANTIRQDTLDTRNKWIVNHEFRTTYRDSLIASESLAEGEWPVAHNAGEIIPVSLSDNLAKDAQVKVGDTLVFNVQGVLMETKVASLRTVDWQRIQLNFSVVFPAGVLEKAPQFSVITTNAQDENISASLQQSLVSEYPNVSILDLRQLLTTVQGILDKISWVINFMAFFSILTGIIVLIGSVRTSKYQRIKESVLLRTLGAKSSQILKITALEYLYLGVLGTGIGIFLSLVASQLLASFVFDTAFIPSWVPFLVLLPGITIIVLLIGLSNSRSVLNSPPLEVLRKEAG
ncbi:putative ABC transport system permease protein [Spirosomataceae bacterium TFI 002]|nr:putative ABC transport system permease protein [Spirosomataceae bacterium TFI 002]